MPRLGQLEVVVMGRLWSYDRPVSVREVLEDIQKERPIAYTTVMTVMDNLYRKGLLARRMEGRAYQYRPTQSREEHSAELIGEALTYSDDRAGVLLHFLKAMPADDVRRLRASLDELALEGPTP